jgi:hypothetical protein
METTQARCDHDSQNAEQQAYRENQQRQKKSHKQNPHRDQMPAGLACELSAYDHDHLL